MATATPTRTWKSSCVRVGVGVIVTRPLPVDEGGEEVLHSDDGLVLVGERSNSHGAGTFALPGGHLELGESWASCAARELQEETGIKLEETSFSFSYVTNDIMLEDSKHYITVFMQCACPQGVDAQLLEPNKCKGWRWVRWSEVPRPVFRSLEHLLDAGYNPFAEDDRARPDGADA